MPASLRTCSPLFWSPDLGIDYGAATLSLRDLLPQVGQGISAFFEPQDRLMVGETLQLIWHPPVSDINGWSEQPSELAHSHLLRARVSGPQQSPAQPMHDLHRGRQRFALQVLACTPLLAALQAQPLEQQAWSLPGIGRPQGACLSWDEAHGCGRADIVGLTCLSAANGNEGMMEMILEIIGDQVSGLLSVHLGPGGNTYEFGRRVLAGAELIAIRRALEHARPLQDTQDAYLVG
ncbi:hypothetical protein [Pseudomonas piscis]|uniref:hypothetical protein n=1 Tax=Pseudomonas piscis TaxID=2614538 RepID=UPI0003B71932|nr:hypothetical protein [Pseudomonas piscis]ERO60403.1 hypothetical protein P308_14345 [Pseudomonas piscis]